MCEAGAPAAAATTAEPSGEQPKKEPKGEVASAKSRFSSLANAGISIGIKRPPGNRQFDDLADDGDVTVAWEVLRGDALLYANDAVHLKFGRIWNQKKRLRLLSVRGDFKGILEDLEKIVQDFVDPDSRFKGPFQIRFYTYLCTLPGCPEQDEHVDHTDPRVWSLIVCIGACYREVTFIVDKKRVTVTLTPGDAVLFRGSVCHFGGPSRTNCRCPATDPCRVEKGKELSVSLGCVEFAMHCYVVEDRPDLRLAPFDWDSLGRDVFSCSARV